MVEGNYLAPAKHIQHKEIHYECKLFPPTPIFNVIESQWGHISGARFSLRQEIRPNNKKRLQLKKWGWRGGGPTVCRSNIHIKSVAQLSLDNVAYV